MQPDEICAEEELIEAFEKIITERRPPAQVAGSAPVIPVEPDPAPPKPTAWQNLNFKDPVRQQTTESERIRRWTAGQPGTTQQMWDMGDRKPLE
jgi:hypothetical protein